MPLVKKEPANLIAKAHVKEGRKKKWNVNSLLYNSLTKIAKQLRDAQRTEVIISQIFQNG